MEIRPAKIQDAAGINEIGNHYILHSPANFKVDALSIEERQEWMQAFSKTGPHRLIVGVENDRVVGYACSSPFHERPAYLTSIATAIYLHPEAQRRGLGTQLYTELFRQLEAEDIHRAFAGITLPNDGSVAIHKKFGFTEVGTFTQAGRKYGKYWDVLWLEKPL